MYHHFVISSLRCFISLVKFFSLSSLFFVVFINGVPLSFFKIVHCLCKVMKTFCSDFCVSILYPVILLYLYLLAVFLVESTGFSMQKTMPLPNRDNFTSFFLFGYLFLLFLALILISNAMVYRSGMNEHACLVLDFRGKAFSFSHLSTWLLSCCGTFLPYLV